MMVKIDQLIDLGVPETTLKQKLKSGEWQAHGPRLVNDDFSEHEIVLESLPQDIQLKWARRNIRGHSATQQSPLLVGLPEPLEQSESPEEQELNNRLAHLEKKEREAWIREAIRLAGIIELFEQINPKQEWDEVEEKYKFVPAVTELCHAAACTEPLIIEAKPHRAEIPSEYTLYGWLIDYRQVRLLAFIPAPYIKRGDSPDLRRAEFSLEAIRWVNQNWSNFSGARHLYKALKKKAEALGWTIPSESWFYRKWIALPAIVRVLLLEGKNAYESKLAPFVPRDVTDLEALQVLSGDFSERDVTVCLPDGTLARPCLALWICLRTDLNWGWNLDLIPSSQSAAIAYANGVRNFGAQPFARPNEDFYSYIYTDRGKPYVAHHWDGQVISVHKIEQLDEGLEIIRIQRRIGILDDLRYKHLSSRGKNPKENPIERRHRIISEWEQNTFLEYCGRNPSQRPASWRKLYDKHMSLPEDRRAAESPFMSFQEYRNELDKFLIQENFSPHEKSTLGGVRIVPHDEYKRLYTTKYSISDETLKLLLMKSMKRKIGKDGVNCFQHNWWFYHEDMSLFKGMDVEVKYDDDDYSYVKVILPNHSICDAKLITPTSILKPNKQTIQSVKDMRAHERDVVNNFEFVAQSGLRGETVEDRVNMALENTEPSLDQTEQADESLPAQVHSLTRLDRRKLSAVRSPKEVTVEEVSNTEVDQTIFDAGTNSKVREFDDDL